MSALSYNLGRREFALVEPLGPRRRTLATAILTVGLFSVFLPLIKLDIPVFNKTHWSPFNIAERVYEGDLPPNATGRDLTSIPIMIPTLYVLQLVALFSLAISRSPVILKNIAVIGVCTSCFWRGDRRSFEELFYGTFSYQNFSLVRRVSFGQQTFMLSSVMGILWFIAWPSYGRSLLRVPSMPVGEGESKRKTINEAQAVVVRRIFEMSSQGWRLRRSQRR